MNANDQFFARDAKVDSAAVAPLPASRKIYVEGTRSDIRVPMREIAQSDTPASFGAEANPPLAVQRMKRGLRESLHASKHLEELEKRYPHEPYRLLLGVVRERLAQTLTTLASHR